MRPSSSPWPASPRPHGNGPAHQVAFGTSPHPVRQQTAGAYGSPPHFQRVSRVRRFRKSVNLIGRRSRSFIEALPISGVRPFQKSVDLIGRRSRSQYSPPPASCCPAEPSQTEPSQTEPSVAERSQAKPSQAKRSQAKPSQAKSPRQPSQPAKPAYPMCDRWSRFLSRAKCGWRR